MTRRHAPIFQNTRPMRGGWTWRSMRVEGDGREFILLFQCNPPRADWKAWLLIRFGQDASIVARLEDRASHPGLHLHAHCQRGGVEVGSALLSDLERAPPAGAYHRRQHAWTADGFRDHAADFFRVRGVQGGLGL